MREFIQTKTYASAYRSTELYSVVSLIHLQLSLVQERFSYTRLKFWFMVCEYAE